MKKVTIIYWSGTGNTEMMAQAIAEGAKGEGAEVKLLNVSDAKPEDVFNANAVALGCPSMGAEILEEEEMEPFVTSLKSSELTDKSVALFGSYDWGDGEWMRDWEERMKQYGANLVESGLIVNLTPGDDELGDCKELGKKLAN
ncbi:flavodoxin, short chain [Anaerovirgula multivorans]|uniref:Flavodoxin n=1 Tax=Anaerovirgula multivorans TaxID=312168 RepID=A0A239CHK3_9FIRM|nr:flavodoxin [Anaerovirgula multivorans]SNS18954.1 flavodoxin, short chain [Anaerovirgula multivorans]